MKKPVLRGYRINKKERLAETFNRIIQEQLVQAADLSERFMTDPDMATHEIRKITKRIRAVYKLFRHPVGTETYLKAIEFYGGVSKLLAGHRMCGVYLETLNHLTENKKLKLNKAYYKRLSSELNELHRTTTRNLIHENQTGRKINDLLTEEKNQMQTAPLINCVFNDIAGTGLLATYTKGRKCLDKVIQQPDMESLHNLRKQVKSIWNQLLLLRPLWPSGLSPLIMQYDHLAEKLGYEHDLAELELYLKAHHPQIRSESAKRLIAFISTYRIRLQGFAIPLASRLYAEKTRWNGQKNRNIL